jgi:hypothetical protein
MSIHQFVADEVEKEIGAFLVSLRLTFVALPRPRKCRERLTVHRYQVVASQEDMKFVGQNLLLFPVKPMGVQRDEEVSIISIYF